jgi:hypothetical protein
MAMMHLRRWWILKLKVKLFFLLWTATGSVAWLGLGDGSLTERPDLAKFRHLGKMIYFEKFYQGEFFP